PQASRGPACPLVCKSWRPLLRKRNCSESPACTSGQPSGTNHDPRCDTHLEVNMSRLTTILMGLASLMLAGGSVGQEAAPPTADGALKLLKDGNERFAQGKLAARNIGAERRAVLAKGQHPFAVVLTCADSRV